MGSRLAAILIPTILAGWLLSLPLFAANNGNGPVVHAVLFSMDNCPACRDLNQHTLPPILARYGEQLQIMYVNVATPKGRQLYTEAAAYANIPDSKKNHVPTMIVGKEALVGSEIGAKLPSMIEEGLKSGGVPPPNIPGMGGYQNNYQRKAGMRPRSFGSRIRQLRATG